MKKTFQLIVENKNKDRQVDSIKNEIRKYIKRERSKKLPDNCNYWNFSCKFGKTQEEAAEIRFVDVTKSIDIAAAENLESFYLELVALAEFRKPKEKTQENNEEEQLED
ncbi:MAG: hypothetical protein KA055_02425 [Aliarcobacter sp.]|nr:hypothetical protein [Aliarcobacter sp.]